MPQFTSLTAAIRIDCVGEQSYEQPRHDINFPMYEMYEKNLCVLSEHLMTRFCLVDILPERIWLGLFQMTVGIYKLTTKLAQCLLLRASITMYSVTASC